MNTYTVKVEQEGDELILPLPPTLCKEMNWDIGDDLVWTDNKDGTFSISKKEQSNQKS